MPVTVESTRLSVPPDFDEIRRTWLWISPIDLRRRYILFVTSGCHAEGVYEYATSSDSIESTGRELRYWSHQTRTQFGVWDTTTSEWVTDAPSFAAYFCGCDRCRVRNGESVERTCDQCGSDFTVTEVRQLESRFCSEECEQAYEDAAEERELRDSGFIRSYYHKPVANFLRANDQDDERLFFGFELELPSNDTYRLGEAIYDGPGDRENVLYCKHDGSISGAEVVSHPMTHRYFRENFPHGELFGDSVRRTLSTTIPNSGYGLHVHVSRAGFKSQAHALRWLLLIYRNAEDMARLARRNSGEWSSFQDIEDCEDKARHVGHGQRYTAVNAQNAQTYEVRVFRSTFTEQEFRAAVDFCHASVVYTRNLNSTAALKGDGLTWTKFREWVDGRPEYEHLSRELARIVNEPVPADEAEPCALFCCRLRGSSGCCCDCGSDDEDDF